MTNPLPTSLTPPVPLPPAIAAVPPPPAPPAPVTLVDEPPAATPDPATAILTLAQLRAAVLDNAGLAQDDQDALKLATKCDLHGAEFEVGKMFPGTDIAVSPIDGTMTPLGPEVNQYIFAIFLGDQHDKTDGYLPGDVRIYTNLMRVTNPKNRDWRCYTFNRQTPSYVCERMTQETFVFEIASEWADLDERINGSDEDEPDDAAAKKE